MLIKRGEAKHSYHCSKRHVYIIIRRTASRGTVDGGQTASRRPSSTVSVSGQSESKACV